MDERRNGGCLCGDVRYQVVGRPIIGGACYCRDCQKTSGGGAAHGMMFPAAALTITSGTPATYDLAADSGNTVFRLFCPKCGVHLISWNSAAPEMRAIKVGTLDDPSDYASQGSVFAQSAQPWHRPDPDLPQHATMPCLADLDPASSP